MSGVSQAAIIQESLSEFNGFWGGLRDLHCYGANSAVLPTPPYSMMVELLFAYQPCVVVIDLWNIANSSGGFLQNLLYTRLPVNVKSVFV
jgi:hypothetical protein